MSLLVLNCPLSSSCKPSAGRFVRGGRGRTVGFPPSPSSSAKTRVRSGRGSVAACLFFDPNREPILKEVLKEPVAFMGGMFAGLLRLDLNEDPLKEWIAKTVEASGIRDEEIGTDDAEPEETPQQIEID